MDNLSDNDVLRLLREAMIGEGMAARNYLLLEKAADADSQQQIVKIRHDEERHRLYLQSIYEEISAVGAVLAPFGASMPTTYKEMLKTSLCDELEAVAFYEYLAECLSCRRHREIVYQIIGDEKTHARILGAMCNKLL